MNNHVTLWQQNVPLLDLQALTANCRLWERVQATENKESKQKSNKPNSTFTKGKILLQVQLSQQIFLINYEPHIDTLPLKTGVRVIIFSPEPILHFMEPLNSHSSDESNVRK